jgi:hypothetical protein
MSVLWRCLYSIFFFFCWTGLVRAQSAYIQIPTKADNNGIRIINLKEKGFVLLDKISPQVINLKKFDAGLLYEWDVQLPTEESDIYLEDYFDGSFLYLALKNQKSNKIKVYYLSVNFAVIQKKEFTVLQGFELTHLKANQEVMAIGGQIKSEPLLVILKTESTVPKYLSLNGKNSQGLQSLNINSSGNIVISMIRSSTQKSELIMRTYTTDGVSIDTKYIPARSDLEFLSSRFFELKGREMVVGNYSKLIFYKEEIKTSQGVYVSLIGQESQTTYYPFENFKNVFSFLSAKEQERLSKQVNRKKGKGKSYSYAYRLNINDLLYGPDSSLLVSSELFQPVFRNVNNSSIIPMSSLYMPGYYTGSYFYNPALFRAMSNVSGRQSRYFEGYNYLSGLVFSINASGGINWDLSLKYRNIFSVEDRMHMKLSQNEGKTLVSYGKEDNYAVAQIDAAGQILESHEVNAQGSVLFKGLRKSKTQNFEHWHGNYFLSWSMIPFIAAEGEFKQVCLVQKIMLE